MKMDINETIFDNGLQESLIKMLNVQIVSPICQIVEFAERYITNDIRF